MGTVHCISLNSSYGLRIGQCWQLFPLTKCSAKLSGAPSILKFPLNTKPVFVLPTECAKVTCLVKLILDRQMQDITFFV